MTEQEKWEGVISDGRYDLVRAHNHPKSHNGYVHKHIVVAEHALGRFLKSDEQVHHFPLKSNFTHLIICQDTTHHMLLHRRYLALLLTGHANWLKCPYCKKYDSPSNLYVGPSSYRHRSCHAKYEVERRSHARI